MTDEETALRSMSISPSVWQASQYGISITYGMWRPTACLYNHIIRFEVLYFYFLQQGLRSSSGFWVVCAIYYTRDLSVKTICSFLVSIVLWTVAASWCWAMDEHGEHTAYSYRFLQQYQPCRKKPEIRCSKILRKHPFSGRARTRRAYVP